MVDILEALLKFDLQEEEIFNLFYSIHSKYMPKLSDALETGITWPLFQSFWLINYSLWVSYYDSYCMSHTVLVVIFNWSCGWRVLDLLIQFYDPLLYRFLKSTQRDIARRAVQWIKSLFRAQLTNDDVTHSLWDIIFQSVDPLLPLWIRFVPWNKV